MATKMKHTRAPWKVSYVPGEFEGCVYAPSNIIAVIDRCAAVANTKAQQRTEADLRLISAAPDLLAACLALKKAGPLGQAQWYAAADMMDAAIAKAFGWRLTQSRTVRSIRLGRPVIGLEQMKE